MKKVKLDQKSAKANKILKMKTIKAVFLGEGRVGKTSIGIRWKNGEFDIKQASTVQAGTYSKIVETSAGPVELKIWDTAGQEEFHAIAPIYYKDAQIAFLVYSILDQKSFDRMVQWHSELTTLRGDQVLIILVANKMDMVKERVVSSTAGMEYAISIGCEQFEVSAKTGQGLDLLFRYVNMQIPKLLAKSGGSKSRKGKMEITVSEEQTPANNNSGCC